MTEPRGPVYGWQPTAETQTLLDDINAVLTACRAEDVLPISVRSLYYRLVGTGRYEKTEQFAARVGRHTSRGRRAGLIPWDAIYDSGEAWQAVQMFTDADDFMEDARERARTMKLYRTSGQPPLLLWCEAKGLIPQVANAAAPYGVPVVSTSGYDSTTIRHEIGTSYDGLEILHVGDYDEHGVKIYRALKEDVQAWAAAYGNYIRVTRLAITPQQVLDYDLPDHPSKPGDVQAESMPPAIMQGIVRAAIEARYDMDAWQAQVDAEPAVRDEVLARL